MTVNPLLSPTTADSSSQVTNPQQTLGQNDFLKLLVAQMTSQDPLNPESGTDFVAQLAQFSSLQTSQAMQGDLASLQANGLIGRTVSVTTATGVPISGVVSAVLMQSGTPSVIVNGQSYALSQIAGILPTTAATTSTSTP